MTVLLAAALVARISLADLDQPIFDVELSLPAGTVRVCLDRDGAGRFVSGLKPEADDADCFAAEGPTLRYRLDVAGLARGRGDPDSAARFGNAGFIVSDLAFLLRPVGADPDTEVRLDWTLPSGISIAAPWTRLPGKAPRFRTTLLQRRTGSYVAVGKLTSLGSIQVPGGALHAAVFAGARRATDDELRSWLRSAGSAVARLYGGLPIGDVNALLIPVHSRTPGVFGSVLRENFASAALLFGDDAEGSSFHSEWMAFHELFHLGNPRVVGRIPWLTEGLATYYQDVLRARAGVATPQAMWDDLLDGLHRFCAPEGKGPYLQRLKRLMRDHEYREYYWGGACWAFRLDLAVRQRSGGRRSLDDVLRELRAHSMDERLDEAGAVAFLDKATSGAASALMQAEGSLMPDLAAKGFEEARRAIFAPW